MSYHLSRQLATFALLSAMASAGISHPPVAASYLAFRNADSNASGHEHPGRIRITRIVPADGAVGVPIDLVIRVTTSIAPIGDQIDARLYELSKRGAGLMTMPIMYDPATFTVTTAPLALLNPQTKFMLVVSVAHGPEDAAGAAIDFTTGH